MVKYQDDALDRTFAALSDPTRRALLARLGEQDGLSVSELAAPFPVSLPAIMGGRADLTVVAAECVPKADRPDHFTLLAELRPDGQGTIIGEARYAYDPAARHGEFAISVADAFQRRGLGLQMMTAMETRASDLGHEMIAAETARANAEMRGPAKKAGFADTGLGDWQSIHFAKRLSR